MLINNEPFTFIFIVVHPDDIYFFIVTNTIWQLHLFPSLFGLAVLCLSELALPVVYKSPHFCHTGWGSCKLSLLELACAFDLPSFLTLLILDVGIRGRLFPLKLMTEPLQYVLHSLGSPLASVRPPHSALPHMICEEATTLVFALPSALEVALSSLALLSEHFKMLARHYGDDCHAHLAAVCKHMAGLASHLNGPPPCKRARGGLWKTNLVRLCQGQTCNCILMLMLVFKYRIITSEWNGGSGVQARPSPFGGGMGINRCTMPVMG
jgi:hypothetical protein